MTTEIFAIDAEQRALDQAARDNFDAAWATKMQEWVRRMERVMLDYERARERVERAHHRKRMMEAHYAICTEMSMMRFGWCDSQTVSLMSDEFYTALDIAATEAAVAHQ